MAKLFIDAGTTWSKILELVYTKKDDHSENKVLADTCVYKDLNQTFIDKNGQSYIGNIYIVPSGTIKQSGLNFDAATGHMIKHSVKDDGYYENEVIALAYGSKKIISGWENSTIVDIGSRDIKWVKFENGKYKDLDWNSTCGSVTGATVEMLCKFYNINPNEIELQQEKIPVTCGVFAMEKIMDAIASNVPASKAIAMYIHGIAYNTWNFAQKPDTIYLSGGFCTNKCFINSLSLYCKVVTMGRFLLLEGLY